MADDNNDNNAPTLDFPADAAGELTEPTAPEADDLTGSSDEGDELSEAAEVAEDAAADDVAAGYAAADDAAAAPRNHLARARGRARAAGLGGVPGTGRVNVMFL